MSNVKQPSGYTIFCDDIREEIGGKISLIGVYQYKKISSATFPVVIPKLCILVNYQPVRANYQGDMIINIFLPGDDEGRPTVTQVVEKPNLDMIEERVNFIPHIMASFAFSPLVIETSGCIRVFIECEKIKTDMGAIYVSSTKSAEL